MSIDDPLEAAAKELFWTQNSIMHDHDVHWRECRNKTLYRELAETVLRAYQRAKRAAENYGAI